MTVYKVLKNLSHIKTNEKLYVGSFCSDNPNATNETHPSGKYEVIAGYIWHDGFLANRPQHDINVLLGYALDIVDKTHPDYSALVDIGIIPTKKIKGDK